jgi:hypothetical protein
VVAACVVTQMNYLNKALDVFNTAVVSPIYYVLFTTFTIAASTCLFDVRTFCMASQLCAWHQLMDGSHCAAQDFEGQEVSAVLTQMCGFVTILGGVWLLHATKDHESAAAKHIELDVAQGSDRRLSVDGGGMVRAKSLRV